MIKKKYTRNRKRSKHRFGKFQTKHGKFPKHAKRPLSLAQLSPSQKSLATLSLSLQIDILSHPPPKNKISDGSKAKSNDCRRIFKSMAFLLLLAGSKASRQGVQNQVSRLQNQVSIPLLVIIVGYLIAIPCHSTWFRFRTGF